MFVVESQVIVYFGELLAVMRLPGFQMGKRSLHHDALSLLLFTIRTLSSGQAEETDEGWQRKSLDHEGDEDYAEREKND